MLAKKLRFCADGCDLTNPIASVGRFGFHFVVNKTCRNPNPDMENAVTRNFVRVLIPLVLIGLAVTARNFAADAAGEAKELFNGKDLTGWDGDAKVWSVQDGAITGHTTTENPIKHNTFL